MAPFQSLMPLLSKHYEREERFFELLGCAAEKFTAQHAEAVEIGRALSQAMAEGAERDVEMLARRFRAIVQHNMLEEERDLFPLAERCLSAAELERAGEWLRDGTTR